MLRKNIVRPAFALLLACGGALPLSPAAPMKIVLDAGHGGDNNGATGKFSKEKDIALSIVLKLGGLLTDHLTGVKVLYTRTTDTLISLEDRGIFANKNNADLFVSIHANGNPDPAPYGTETYVITYDKTNKNMETAVAENAAIEYEKNSERYEDYYDVDVIVSSVAQSEFYRPQSIELAGYVEEEFAKYISRHSRGPKEGPFLVLWKATMPRILIEVGFITNPEEERYIASDQGQNELAAAIFRAVERYKKRYFDDAKKKPAIPARSGNYQDANLLLPQKVSDNKITYHVQIFSVSTPLSRTDRRFKGIKPHGCYKSGDTYRYYVGKESSLKACESLLREVKQKFPDAFIVKLKNNQPFQM
jgi:N-acetylmuramoyl-L-alanine amidase